MIAGRAFGGRVVSVPGVMRWTWRGDGDARREPVRLRAEVRLAALPEAGFWYRPRRAFAVEARATSDGITSVVGAWHLDPRSTAIDRGVHTLDRELIALPGRELTLELRTSDGVSAAPAPPILAEVTLRPAR